VKGLRPFSRAFAALCAWAADHGGALTDFTEIPVRACVGAAQTY
jgi:hypothetical protein